jgi:hypothetical protein
MAAPPPARLRANASGYYRAKVGFERAARASPGDLIESEHNFAGQHVRLRIVGRELARTISRPFEHLRLRGTLPAAPRLTIDLWDVSATGLAGPRQVESATDGRTWRVQAGILSTSADGRCIGFEQDQSASWLDRAAGRIVGWRACGDQLSTYERGKPFPLLLSLWYRNQGIQVVHAGLVSRRGQGVLLAGPSGAGKSTTALACLQSGFSYLADDHCGLQNLSQGTFVGHSLYASARLAPEHISRFRLLERNAVWESQPDEKALLYFAGGFTERLERQVPITLLILPRYLEQVHEPRTRPARPSEALLRIALSSVFVPLEARAQAVASLGDLVEAVPSFWLEFGRDLSEIPAHIEHLLDQTA